MIRAVKVRRKDPGMWRIKDWDSHYENADSRRVQTARWVPVKNKQDGDGYLTLLDAKDGPALYGAFVSIQLLASKCSPRGTLVQSNGVPHTAETIARKTHMPARLIQDCLSRCVAPDIEWIEWVEDDRTPADLFASHAGPAGADGYADGSRVVAGCGSGSESVAPPSSGRGNGSSLLITSSEAGPPSEGGEGGEVGGGEERGADPEVLVFACREGKSWTLKRSHLGELAATWKAKVDVAACLADLSRRLERESKLRKPAEDMPTYLQNWIGQDFRKFHNFPAGSDERQGARGPGKPAAGKPKGVEERALELLRSA